MLILSLNRKYLFFLAHLSDTRQQCRFLIDEHTVICWKRPLHVRAVVVPHLASFLSYEQISE